MGLLRSMTALIQRASSSNLKQAKVTCHSKSCNLPDCCDDVASSSSRSSANCELQAPASFQQWQPPRCRPRRGVEGEVLEGDQISQTGLEEELQRMLDIALDCPRRLLSGRDATTWQRLLRCSSRLKLPNGEFPWQLRFIQERLDGLMANMGLDEVYACMGHSQGSPAMVPERVMRSLPRILACEQDLVEGVGADSASCCGICLTKYLERQVLCELPGCGHVFHDSCLVKWLRARGDCPLCRHEVSVPPARSCSSMDVGSRAAEECSFADGMEISVLQVAPPSPGALGDAQRKLPGSSAKQATGAHVGLSTAKATAVPRSILGSLAALPSAQLALTGH